MNASVARAAAAKSVLQECTESLFDHMRKTKSILSRTGKRKCQILEMLPRFAETTVAIVSFRCT
eukprot:4761874-Amphidinium_carterae.1